MLVISPQQPCGIGRYSLVSGNSPMRASDPTNHLQCLPQSIKVSPRWDEGIPPYRLLALPAAYYKKLCRERLIPVQEPNQRSGWPLKFDCGRSDLPYIFRITLPAKNLSPCNLVRRTEKGRLRRRGWGLRWEKAQKGGKGTNLRGFFED